MGGKSFTPFTGSYGSLYYIITGFHMLHVIAGVLILLTLSLWCALGYFNRIRSAPVTIGAIYWHFVDAVWLVLFFTFTSRHGWDWVEPMAAPPRQTLDTRFVPAKRRSSRGLLVRADRAAAGLGH